MTTPIAAPPVKLTTDTYVCHACTMFCPVGSLPEWFGLNGMVELRG